MGFSPYHSTRAPHVLNIKGGPIELQFHLLFDDCFSLVHSYSAKNSSIWNQILLSPNTSLQIELDHGSKKVLIDVCLTSEEDTVNYSKQREEA